MSELRQRVEAEAREWSQSELWICQDCERGFIAGRTVTAETIRASGPGSTWDASNGMTLEFDGESLYLHYTTGRLSKFANQIEWVLGHHALTRSTAAPRGTYPKRLAVEKPEPASIPCTFILVRDEDETGVTGTGRVAEGVIYSDGHVSMRWIVGEHRSTVAYDSITAVEAIHGHGGKTKVVIDHE